MGISKTIRFEVFKRDKFRCQYCGKTPPDITLEIDHIQPKSKKGQDDINNLITSCFDCNRGKRDIVLKCIPNSIALNLEILKEKEVQLKEYNKFIQKIQKRIQIESQEINAIFTKYYNDKELSDKFINSSLKNFLNRLPKEEVIDAMDIACQYMSRRGNLKSCNDAVAYFCGICWKKIRGSSNGED